MDSVTYRKTLKKALEYYDRGKFSKAISLLEPYVVFLKPTICFTFFCILLTFFLGKTDKAVETLKKV